MTITIEKMASVKVIYMRKTGPYGFSNFQLMEKFKSWLITKGLLTASSVILGIIQDNPRLVKPEACRYDTCLVVASDYGPVEDGVFTDHILGGKYAVLMIAHTAEAIQNAWGTIFEELIRNGLIIDETRPLI
jgi:DNA gyrase inhibitor GyrI